MTELITGEARLMLRPLKPRSSSLRNRLYHSRQPTFGTRENPRLWVDYGPSTVSTSASIALTIGEVLAQLRIRISGQQEEEQTRRVSTLAFPARAPALSEALGLLRVRSYFREQFKTRHPRILQSKLRSDDSPRRTPLNVADYARVPLLNPNHI